MRTFFQPSKLKEFSQALRQYISETMKTPIELTENEIVQLSWYMDSTVVTPEATEKDIQAKLHFEIKRGLARRYGFELLLRGDDDAYQEFIASQKKGFQLSHERFDSLSAEARAMSDDLKIAVKATCFLTLSENAKKVAVAPTDKTFSTDSEEFLSQLCGESLALNKMIFPVLSTLTESQLSLMTKAFWPNMHFRHMLFTEGGVQMTKTFSDGVLSHQFSRDDFKIWKWRWLTNLFGFQLGQGAKCFDAPMSVLSRIVFSELEKLFNAPTENNFLKSYLLMRASIAEFNQMPQNDQLFLGHLAAYFHQINIMTPELGASLLAGYQQFNQANRGNTVASAYVTHCFNPQAVTPTYVPAVLNNAFVCFEKTMDEKSAVSLATKFMCQFLQSLYACPIDQRISCMDLAQAKVLQPVLTDWLSDHHAVQFEFVDGVAKRVRSVALVCGSH
ncbi:MAG: hypothetical protein A3F13_01610 [Gammaproteobacteria bacterium RIFCSPHIGHO2_12_FULL_40_19]|nr:MAG: hypothetical protein A3F13_01610 [Gammaproteobacteria bacterium RIFCSPHIGHO2_12_FULL_40_19]